MLVWLHLYDCELMLLPGPEYFYPSTLAGWTLGGKPTLVMDHQGAGRGSQETTVNNSTQIYVFRSEYIAIQQMPYRLPANSLTVNLIIFMKLGTKPRQN